MEITFYKKTEAINTPVIARDAEGNATEFGEPFSVMLWKFIDDNGNLWNTETPIDGTEEQAVTIIMNSMNNGN
jgi:hypothetical protein